MTAKRLVSAIAILAMLQGCSVARRELRHSGGFPGSLMDRRFFDASSSKELQLLRLTMVIALASRVANATIQDGREADAFLSYLRNATNEVNYLAAHLYGQAAIPAVAATATSPATPATPARYTCSDLTRPHFTSIAPSPAAGATVQCSTYQALFEADLPMLEHKVARLVLAALPQQQAAGFARAMRTGNVANAAWQFLKLAAASVDGLHRGAAAYRSSQEILAIVIVSAAKAKAQGRSRQYRQSDGQIVPADEDVRCANGVSDPALIRTIEDATDCLGLSRTSLFDNRFEDRVVFPRTVGPEAFHALFELIHTSCVIIPLNIDPAETPGEAGRAKTPTSATEDRRETCASLQFVPTLRFGGRNLQ